MAKMLIPAGVNHTVIYFEEKKSSQQENEESILHTFFPPRNFLRKIPSKFRGR
jgi:hypothetical protein